MGKVNSICRDPGCPPVTRQGRAEKSFNHAMSCDVRRRLP